MRRFPWLLFVAGVLLRCVALTQPLVDAHPVRQCQTAAITEDLADAHGWPLTTHIPWIGDLPGEYILELPIFNLLSLAVGVVTGDLDLGGKVVSVGLWAISFLVLQPLWRRLLTEAETGWANLLFVVAPLSVFFAQAVMPEMLVQALAFGFVLLLLRYDESPTAPRLAAAALVGLLGLLVKAPEIAHLYLILVALEFRRDGWRGLIRPRLVVAGVVSAAVVLAWMNFSQRANASPYSFGSAASSVAGFVGPLAARFQLRPWLMIALYVGAFIIPGLPALAVALGLREIVRRPRFLLGAWLVATVAFYLVWFGNAGTAQSYYNLPALAPLCALFAVGVRRFLEWERVARWRTAAVAAIAVATIATAVPVWVYLFRQDRIFVAVRDWAQQHTAPGAVLICEVNHRADLSDYGANPIFHHLTKRPTFIWTPAIPDGLRDAALERGRYVILTKPQPPPQGFVAWLDRFRQRPTPRVPDVAGWEARGFQVAADTPDFVALQRP